MEQQPAAPPRGPNPLGTEKISVLIRRFAIPAVIGMLVSATYNIVDQIFIGQGVGMLGNAATNIAFPLNTLATALALMLGVGSASNFNLNLGAGKKDEALHIVGNGVVLVVGAGLLLMLLALLFLTPLLHAFGATEDVFPYAYAYTRITSLGLPLLLLSIAGSHLIRADGSPTHAMAFNLVGAGLNVLLDPLFIFGFGWGIAGAAWATVISQALAALLTLRYLRHYRTAPLAREYLTLRWRYVKAIARLGIAAFLNHFVMMLVQITMNNTLRYYGAESVYGSDIPLACVGVITKVSFIMMAFAVGLAQGCQPIFGYNYGARQYARVKQTYRIAATVVIAVSTAFFLCFQLFPRQIVAIFGSGSELYFQFSERYFRIYMMLVFISCIQPLTANFFTSIGKAKYGVFISMTRQGLFLLPLILLLPRFFGIDGVMYAGPVSDAAAVILAIIFVIREMRKMTALQQAELQRGADNG